MFLCVLLMVETCLEGLTTAFCQRHDLCLMHLNKSPKSDTMVKVERGSKVTCPRRTIIEIPSQGESGVPVFLTQTTDPNWRSHIAYRPKESNTILL